MEHIKLSGEVVTNRSAFSQEAEGSWHWKETVTVCGRLPCFSKLILKETVVTMRVRQASDIFGRRICACGGY